MSAEPAGLIARPVRFFLLATLGALVIVLGVHFATREPAADAAVDTIAGNVSWGAGKTIPAGTTIRFDPNKSTTVTVSGNVVVNGVLEMKPANANVIHTLRFTGINESNFVGGGMDPIASDVGLWVMGSGQLNLQGTPKTAWSYTWQSSWKSSDEIYAAPNTPGNYSTFKKITSATQVPAKNALGYSTELLNLTRNVRVEGTTSGYTHVFIRSLKPSTIKNAAFRYVGPDPGAVGTASDATGRYGLHIHMCGNGSRGTIVDGLVIRDTKAHAFVPHLSNGITFRNTIAYNVKGEAYWWDEGDSSVDIVFDKTVAALVKKATGGENHRMSAYFLGRGTRVTVTNSVAVGIDNDEGGQDRSGFLWPENAEATWVFNNNRAHNNESHGIFVWQNNELPHVIDGFIAYYNKNAGVEHGAYNNSYVYKNLTLLGNGRPITSHALGKPGDTNNTDTQIWANIKTKGGTLIIEEHSRPGHVPVRFVGCDFGRIEVGDGGGPYPSMYDFINCGLEPSKFNLSGARSDSVFRVQRSNGTAYRLMGNGSVTTISKFYNGTVPGTPGVPGGGGGFSDTVGNQFADAIKWLADKGITKGCNPPANTKFCPDDHVTRGEMAAFLVRARGYSAGGSNDYFSDDNGSPFETAINRLRAAGVTQGCNPPKNNHFCPDRKVTRGEMAAFLVRAFKYTNAGKGNYFTDDNNSPFESAIDKIRVAGVTQGCNPPANNHYCPDHYVTRGQMAAFLKRAMGG